MRRQLFQTRLTEMLGIRHPILCGGMGPGLSDARYVAAVVRAGAMGFMTAFEYEDPEEFRDLVRNCAALAGGRKFGVNMYMSRRPNGIDRYRPLIKVMAEESVPFVETSGLSPEPLLPAFRDAGVKVIHKVPAVRYARSAERAGVDAVIVVGGECGGHPGKYQIGSMVQAAEAPLKLGIPVAIGGGIGHGSQIPGVLGMGNDAVVLGTRMLVAEELWIHRDYKEMVLASDGTNNKVVLNAINDAHRQLDNETTRAIEALERAGVTDMQQYLPHISGDLRKRAYRTGDYSTGSMGLGNAAMFANRIEPVEAIIDSIIDEAAAALGHLDMLRRSTLEQIADGH